MSSKKELSLDKYRIDFEKSSDKSSEFKDIRSTRLKLDDRAPGPTSYFPKEYKFAEAPSYR